MAADDKKEKIDFKSSKKIEEAMQKISDNPDRAAELAIEKTVKKSVAASQEEKMNDTIKELEQAFFTLKFYPVAASEEAKEDAIQKIKDIHTKEDETIKQLILYMVHEALAQSSELKTMYNFDYFRRKFPNAEPAQIRVNVYRAMFNYNFSLEGMLELIKLLGQLDSNDAAKLLTYHFSFLSSIEVEGTHMLKNAIIDALGESQRDYALRSLLQYARYTDNERLLQRIASSLAKWDQKIENLKITRIEKEKLRKVLEEVLTLEFGDSHYG